MLITGGFNPYNSNGDGARLKSAEIYNPRTGESCSLPELPDTRNAHTQNGEMACGGGSAISKGPLVIISSDRSSGKNSVTVSLSRLLASLIAVS